MANIGSLFVDVDANTSGLEAGLARAQRATQKFSQSARRAAGGFARIAKESQSAVPPIGNMTRLLGTLSGYLGARQVIQYADAWNNAGNQLRQVTNTASELNRVQETLMGVANDTRSEFESTANLYSRLARSTTELGLSQSDLVGLTKTINQSFAVSGATAGEAAAAITQLSQGLAAGALRGDEFNSVSEQAPALMRAIAESLDMTIGELREFAAEGGITAEIVVKALQESADEIENNFSKAVATFGQQMTVARNNMLQFVGGSNDLNEALSNIGGAAITASENLDLAAKALGALAALVAGRIAGRLYAMAAGMTAAAGAATALRTALAFLGGPAGILVAVAGGIFTFRQELGLIPSPVKDAREEIDLLTGSIENMNRAGVQSAMISINAQLFDLEKQAREAREEMERINNSQNVPGPLRNSMVGPAGEARQELTGIQAQQRVLTGRMEELKSFLTSTDEAAKGADRLEKSTNDASKALEDFTAQLSPEAEDILDRAGEGSTIDANGILRDAWGNALPTLQRELDKQIMQQINDFSAEQNLMKGLEAAAQRFVDGASTAVSKAWNSIRPDGDANGKLMPTGEQSKVTDLAEPRSAVIGWSSINSSSSSGLMPTNSQSSAPERAMQGSASANGKNIGTVTLAKEGGGKIDVQANADELGRFVTDLFTGVAAGA